MAAASLSLDTLADLILGGEDHVSLYTTVKPFLTPTDRVLLAAKTEICPVHDCDIQICLDDEVHGEEVYDTAT